jgi:hypothetical protein
VIAAHRVNGNTYQGVVLLTKARQKYRRAKVAKFGRKIAVLVRGTTAFRVSKPVFKISA